MTRFVAISPRRAARARDQESERRSDRPDPTSRVLCNAPFVALDFDPFGNVQACCANALYPLGDVVESDLRSIWSGARADGLRRAIEQGDLSFGCTVCRYRLDFAAGDVPRDYYDQFAVGAGVPEWPQLLSFSLHNTCNLECIMCGGDASSRIRTRRDGAAPLPHVYGDDFFAQLEPFLEHCTAVDMVGGEPFLVREHRRVWDLLVESGNRPKMSVTTNGTVWNDTVEKVLDTFDTTVCVSFDGMSAATFERVRVGASFPEVMTNLERFRSYARGRGTGVHLSFSLVRQNWFELGSVLRFADDGGMEVTVQTVIEPEFGVQRLPTDELRTVVESLELESVELLSELTINRGVFLAQLGRLQAELRERGDGRPRPVLMEPPSDDNANAERVATTLRAVGHARGGPLSARWRRHNEVAARAASNLRSWGGGRESGRLVIGSDGAIVHADLRGVLPEGSPPPDVIGCSVADLLAVIADSVGGELWIGEESSDDDRTMLTLWFGPRSRDKQGLVQRWIAWADGDTVVVRLSSDFRMMPRSSDGVSVSLRSRA